MGSCISVDKLRGRQNLPRRDMESTSSFYVPVPRSEAPNDPRAASPNRVRPSIVCQLLNPRSITYPISDIDVKALKELREKYRPIPDPKRTDFHYNRLKNQGLVAAALKYASSARVKFEEEQENNRIRLLPKVDDGCDPMVQSGLSPVKDLVAVTIPQQGVTLPITESHQPTLEQDQHRRTWLGRGSWIASFPSGQDAADQQDNEAARSTFGKSNIISRESHKYGWKKPKPKSKRSRTNLTPAQSAQRTVTFSAVDTVFKNSGTMQLLELAARQKETCDRLAQPKIRKDSVPDRLAFDRDLNNNCPPQTTSTTIPNEKPGPSSGKLTRRQ